MRAVVQRVSSASIEIDDRRHAQMGRGLVVLAGFSADDSEQDLQWMAGKIAGLRTFEDDEGKMNLSVGDVGGQVLAVPNFTLYADCNKGRRPSFGGAAPPDVASGLFDTFCEYLKELTTTHKGVFGAHMKVSLTNDGPVTLLVDSEKTF